MSKFLVIVGCILILVGVALRVTGIPLIISMRAVKPSSFLILANTTFILSLVCRK